MNKLRIGCPSSPLPLGKSASKRVITSPPGERDSGNGTSFIPVRFQNKPLMPCHPARARELIRKGRAKPRFKKSIYYIELINVSSQSTQPIAAGVDKGSKKEGYTVKSKKRTLLNIQADAITWVKDAVSQRREMRRSRRFRKTPCRQNRKNRARGGIPPSTKARWAWTLRVCQTLSFLYPITIFVVEDIGARTKKGQTKWNTSFSPLEIGKKWFYEELRKTTIVETRKGYETKEIRDKLGLKKSKNKLESNFNAHCVDSWSLAWSVIGGATVPDNKKLMLITPIRLHRRQLHVLQPGKGGIRRPYGSTRSIGLKRGSLVKHAKHGVAYVGGHMKGKISLHRVDTGERFVRNINPVDCVVLEYNTWRRHFPVHPSA